MWNWRCFIRCIKYFSMRLCQPEAWTRYIVYYWPFMPCILCSKKQSKNTDKKIRHTQRTKMSRLTRICCLQCVWVFLQFTQGCIWWSFHSSDWPINPQKGGQLGEDEQEPHAREAPNNAGCDWPRLVQRTWLHLSTKGTRGWPLF